MSWISSLFLSRQMQDIEHRLDERLAKQRSERRSPEDWDRHQAVVDRLNMTWTPESREPPAELPREIEGEKPPNAVGSNDQSGGSAHA